MKNYFTSIFTVLTLSLTVTSSAFSQETSKPAAEDKVEAKKPSLTYYFIEG